MRVCIIIEHRMLRTPDGAVWTQMVFPYTFWQRYLTVFSAVRVVTRVEDVASVQSDWVRVDGERVEVYALPNYRGPLQYLRMATQVTRRLRHAYEPTDAVILRVPSLQVAACVEPQLTRSGHPFGVEVVADIYDLFAPGAMRHPLRPLLRWLYPRQLKRQCGRACAASYVTANALQQNYPPNPQAFATHYSSVQLPADAFVSLPRSYAAPPRPCTIITIGTLNQLYKAPDVLIEAVAQCIHRGDDLQLVLVGDGIYREELAARAAALGIGERVHFRGQVPTGARVWAELDQADLFVLPSLQEGLPRAMIEAMARGVPCIGSTVGGIPELLPAEDLVPPGDLPALTRVLHATVHDPVRLSRMAAHSFATAAEYADAVLDKRRQAFYQHVLQATDQWNCTRVTREDTSEDSR
jgi:glycosyltransferase involved in cell wall biosynthesis